MPSVKPSVNCISCSKPSLVSDCVVDPVGHLVCSDCVRTQYIFCPNCTTMSPNSETEHVYGHSSDRVCSSCARAYHNCYSCGIRIETTSDTIINTHHYCGPCSDDECTECEDCGELFENPQLREGLCHACYTSENPIEDLPKKCRTRYLTDRCFGIELEFENVSRNDSSWHTVHDGSLENGTEFVSGPMRGTDGIDKVKEQVRLIDGDISRRCSYHLHIDTRDLSEETVKKITMTALSLQDWVKTVVSASRRNNEYCRMYNRDVQIQLGKLPLDEWIYFSKENSELKSSKYNQSRYYWFNAHSHFFRNTIEIRIHQGTKNASKILRWAELWLKIVRWSMKQDIRYVYQNYLDPEWHQTVLRGIGLRDSTRDYFNERIQYFAQRREQYRSRNRRSR